MDIREILRLNNFRFNHKLGQNFITDGNLLDAIVGDSGLQGGETVVEIGTGAGTLTRALAKTAGKVITFEVDRNLKPVLDETLKGLDNVEVVFSDVLKLSDDEIRAICGDEFRVVANIPYYITTSLIMRFLESDLGVKSITVMIQKEVAERLIAKENTAEYGAITLSVRLRGDARITRSVGRNMFFPAPNVDSAVIDIDLNPDKYDGEDKPLILKLIKACFGMRRKTLANNLVSSFGLTKQQAEDAIEAAGFNKMVRGEALSLDDVIALSHHLIF